MNTPLCTRKGLAEPESASCPSIPWPDHKSLFLEVHDLTYAWPVNGRGQAAEPVLQGVSFELEQGQRLCVCGCNGGGKSTLLQLLAGILEPLAGSVALNGEKATADTLRKRTALLMQDADMQIIGSTVGEDLLLCSPQPDAAILARTRDMAARFALDTVWERPVQALSYGQKRKLCLCSALLAQPDILLLDEPCGGLDYPALLGLRAQLRENAGLAQIITTHELEPVIDLADVVLVLHEGKQVCLGTPEEALRAVEVHPEWGIRPPCHWLSEHTIVDWET